MGMLVLNSDNEKMSFVISKNPESGMTVRSIRKGKAFGFYPEGNENTYVIYFKDGEDEISYKRHVDDKYEYLTLSKYNSPVFILNAITEFFDSVIKKDVIEFDDVVNNHIHIPFIEIKRFDRVLQLGEFLKGVTINYKHEGSNNYQVDIYGECKISDLFHNVIVWATFVSVYSDVFLDTTQGLVDKLLRSINKVDVPYYLRYAFNLSVIVSQKMFKESKELLEKTDRYKLELHYGGTGMQRRDFVSNHLDFNRSILDIGSGEGFYTFPYAKKIAGKFNVFAIDIDDEVRDKLQHKIDKRDIENITIYEELDDFLYEDSGEEVDVLMVEVIEHMSKEEAEDLIKEVLEEVTFNKIIITTPNKDFNKYYEMGEEMRHNDHKWEMTGKEFTSFMKSILDEYHVSYKFYQVGDKVDGISPSQSVVINYK